ncbi:leader peptidase (prepilin peptidase)/N-methyltransferase [Sphingomonas jinjuensis]|uniref:Prepilin leader peptidase/N-methyltransferase n=1 Tax=Sphingomonas jinjuensis TaxID=535907 RepID=A0A840F2F6_9SPHN|nr:A24 family peptidase [Sphingomonas jinjuensis]MBB4153533.1 leader peptidase (prepilin peptidase)/N-methyltransferase [Sphingomonas jinjuensis]
MLGAIVGSFLATLVVRWPAGRGLGGRSACDGCGRTLTAIELVPLVSAAVQRWRCRSCGAAIDPRHGLIEAGCALIGVTAGVAVAGPEAMAGAMFGWLLLTLAALDVAVLWLPDRLTGTLAVAGLATGALGVWPPIEDRLIGGVAGFGVLWLIAAAYRRIRGRTGMGGGDPKLLGAIGLWLGWRMLPAVLLLASLIGVGLVLAARMSGRTVSRETAMPFGALMAVAAYPAWLVMIGAVG